MVLLKRSRWITGVGTALLMGLAGCGSQPTIPVEEHSSVKPPKQREVYYRAAPVVSPRAAVAARPAREEPITYQAVEPEPVWEEIPAADPEPPRAVARTRQPVQSTIEPMQPERSDDPLLGMMEKIERAMQQGEYQRAEGLLERALRIDSQRPGLWHDLAQVRYQQNAYQEAVTLARRSNSLTRSGSVLKEENWALIARSKEALGDIDGANAAWQKAGR